MAKAKTKKNSGAKYKKWLEKEQLVLLQGWAREGLTDKEISNRIGISDRTLYLWKRKHPHIAAALKIGKEHADMAVEQTLFKQATNGNVTAMIYWLNNRKPDKWRNRIKDKMDREEQQLKIDLMRQQSEIMKRTSEIESDSDFILALKELVNMNEAD